MNAKRRLGRGLDALLKPEGAAAPAPAAGAAPRTLPTSKLRPNRLQPRSVFADDALDELAASIRAQGIVQPIVVTALGDGYSIIAGERRWRAAQRAGLKEVPVVVRGVESDSELLALALVENLQRADLNPLEEALAYRALAEDHALSQEEVGRLVGKSRAAVANTLRLLKLTEPVRELVGSGALTAGQARPLLAVDDPERQRELAERAVTEGLTARSLEKMTSTRRGAKPRRSPDRKVDADTAAAEAKLQRRLQTKVEIHRSGQGGKVALHFHSEEELMRIYDLLIAAGRSS